jgi:hypothetical protein
MRRTQMGITEEMEQQMLAAAEADKAETARLAALFPEGPFTGATSPVINHGLGKASARITEHVARLLQAAGLPHLRVLITSPGAMEASAVKQQLHLYGKYESVLTAQFDFESNYGSTRRFGPNSNDHYISIDVNRTEAVIFETLNHEVGHIIFTRLFSGETTETKQAVLDAYQQWLVESEKMSDPQLVASTRPVATARDIAKNARKDTASGGYTLTDKSRKYFKDFEEWFADQVARYVTTEAAPRSIVEKFFASVAESIRALVGAIYGNKPYTNAAMKTYLDGVMARAKAGQMGGLVDEAVQAQEETDAKFSKAPEFLKSPMAVFVISVIS